MLMQGLCCVRDIEGGFRFLRRAALQEEPNAMLYFAQVLEDGVYLPKSNAAAAFYLNRTILAVSDATDGSLDHLKATPPPSPCTSLFTTQDSCKNFLQFSLFLRLHVHIRLTCHLRSNLARYSQSCGLVKIRLKFSLKRGCLPFRLVLMQAMGGLYLLSQGANYTVGVCKATKY